MLHGHHMKKRLSKNKSYIYFVYPGNINAKTGGYIYEKNQAYSIFQLFIIGLCN